MRAVEVHADARVQRPTVVHAVRVQRPTVVRKPDWQNRPLDFADRNLLAIGVNSHSQGAEA